MESIRPPFRSASRAVLREDAAVFQQLERLRTFESSEHVEEYFMLRKIFDYKRRFHPVRHIALENFETKEVIGAREVVDGVYLPLEALNNRFIEHVPVDYEHLQIVDGI